MRTKKEYEEVKRKIAEKIVYGNLGEDDAILVELAISPSGYNHGSLEHKNYVTRISQFYKNRISELTKMPMLKLKSKITDR